MAQIRELSMEELENVTGGIFEGFTDEQKSTLKSLIGDMVVMKDTGDTIEIAQMSMFRAMATLDGGIRYQPDAMTETEKMLAIKSTVIHDKLPRKLIYHF